MVSNGYLDTAPLKAISEIEYALPHVSNGNFSNALENELDKPTALIWLSHKYLELKIPSKALEYATQFIEIKKQKKTLVASDYVIAIRAAISLSKTDLAQALVEGQISNKRRYTITRIYCSCSN